MNALNGKNILLGISGGIAAYKSADLCRRLQQAGAKVRIVMTQAATGFVTPLTFQALSGQPVALDMQDSDADNAMAHIRLARWADAIVIAPASANTIAQLATGRADNLLTSLCLASEAKKCFAPAMNRVMWDDLATQGNCRTLRQHGWQQLGPATGAQACGETGEGRMLEPLDILEQLNQAFSHALLAGVEVLITAGPTYEPIDPVRFIGNRSSGRMGFAIAAAAREAGARVTLVSGPVALDTPEGIARIDVETAAEMQQAVFDHLPDHGIFIASAAVSDYRVAEVAEQKIKKSAETLQLSLQRNEDILSAVSASAGAGLYMVGFAAETENLIAHASDKLLRKNLDMIVANQVGGQRDNPPDGPPDGPTDGPTDAQAQATPAIGFNSEYNALHIITPAAPSPQGDSAADTPKTTVRELGVATKTRLASELIDIIAAHYRHKQHHAQDTA